MYKRERDTQRSRVYKSDRALIEIAKPLPTMRDVERYVTKVFASKRVQAAYPKATGSRWKAPVVKDGRGRRRACGGYWGISMPTWARNEAIVLHELAHVICQRETNSLLVAGHGWQFCAIYLRLVLYSMGREAHDALKAAMRQNRVRFAPPRVRAPLSPERRAALADRLATYRAAKRQPDQGVRGRFAGLDIGA